MQTLHEKLYQTSDFLFGVELVSIRGSMAEKSALRARVFSNQLIESPLVDWISITDNAGGNPQLAPQALGKPILYAGKEVVIHLTCKDLNRNGLESEAWQLHSEGFHNVLAMTGDYPVSGNGGMPKPVFDIDSVGLITLLNNMNRGLDDPRKTSGSEPHVLDKTHFFIGAVTTNYKLLEGEVVPQYLKLQKKVECGAQFIINQVGYDARKMHELRLYMNLHAMNHIPLIGNVYILNPRVARLFHDHKIPGIVVTPQLLDLCARYGNSPDKGAGFFYEFAAKQIAVYRHLGYRGIYLGGAPDFHAIERIIEVEKSFAPEDWKIFVDEIKFSRPHEYYYYDDPALPPPAKTNDAHRSTSTPAKPPGISYLLSRWVHRVMFTRGSFLGTLGTKLYSRSKIPDQGPTTLRAMEHLSKTVLFRCKDCGDCSLPEIMFLCPESQCAKNQRNGPCGGTLDGHCEVEGFGDCIWLRAYERARHEKKEERLLDHAPVVQNQGLRGTSAWANFLLGRDHAAKNERLHNQLPDSSH
ncbi:MAG TPA: methylenetetrahydrofolate reductase C-terminal domain-containing protein [Bacteroidota bacterium]|nr:methylenetetrahydrofolate reductase C-terminal domain-containing protein [Bacteroidota bacterium]